MYWLLILVPSLNGHEYILLDNAVHWNEARQLCMHQGMALVSIESVREMQFLESLVAGRMLKPMKYMYPIKNDNLLLFQLHMI